MIQFCTLVERLNLGDFMSSLSTPVSSTPILSTVISSTQCFYFYLQ